MKKLKWFILLIAALFVTGCKDYLLDFSDISFNLDKTSFKTNENMVLTCTGSFAENDMMGNIHIYFYICKIENGEKNYGKENFFSIVDCGTLENESMDINDFQAFISKKSSFVQVNEKIVLNISQPGDYEIFFELSCSVDGAPYRQAKYEKFLITVIE